MGPGYFKVTFTFFGHVHLWRIQSRTLKSLLSQNFLWGIYVTRYQPKSLTNLQRSLNTITFLKKSLFCQENDIYRILLGQNQCLWRHFGLIMSPCKLGCFSAPERGDFSKNSGILQRAKMGPVWGRLCLSSIELLKSFLSWSRHKCSI